MWSIDLTEVYYWGLWKIYVLVAIDHFSRKVVAVTPLEGLSTGFVINALEEAFVNSGKPKHLISDHGSVFTSAAFREFIDSNRVKIRYGAIGEHGSIAVTERVIETLKYEWLKKVAIIRGYRHLVSFAVISRIGITSGVHMNFLVVPLPLWFSEIKQFQLF